MIRFDVPDMSCGACADRIGRALGDAGLPAGLSVEIDVAARQVRLPQAAPAGTAQAVREAIERAGYTAQAAADTPARAGGCCCSGRREMAMDAARHSPARAGGCCG